MLPTADRLSICFAHVAYRFQQRFAPAEGSRSASSICQRH